MTKKIFLHEPLILDETSYLLRKELKKNDLVIGKYLKKFENKINLINRSKYCTLVSSGTAALHLVFNQLRIDKNYEVMLPSISFIASLNSILYTGASPIFFDVDENLNLKIEDILHFLEKETFQDKFNNCVNKKTKNKIKCLLLIHVFGNIINYSKIIQVANKKNIQIIEDAAESFGSYALIKNKRYYSGSIGKYACFSFNGNKIITSAGGGAIISKKKSDKKSFEYFSNQAKSNALLFKHSDIGFNYRLSNIQATIGYKQTLSLQKIIEKKKLIFKLYLKYLDQSLFKTIKYDIGSNYWLIVISISRRTNILKLINFMSSKNIEVRPVWFPLHKQPYSKHFQKFNLINASNIHRNYLCLPSSASLSELKIKYICKSLKDYF